MTLLALLVMGAAGTASANEEGFAWLQDVNVDTGTVTINDMVMRVTDDSRLTGRKGERMQLSDFQAGKAGPAPGIMSIDDADRVRFDAREEGGVLVVRSMTQISRGPE